ncbi:MAG: ribosome-associated translation inhibitor RaiA [Bdellovibrionales bacterium]|nr:ribosome-associated translation inhibitor RaiA [Oligoflexia bacterium]
MQIKISYKQLESSAAIDEVTRNKSEKLKKYFRGKLNLNWIFTVEKQQHIAHCHLTGDNIDFYAEANTDSIYTSIDQVVHHLDRQVGKSKQLVTNHHKVA